MATSYGSRLDQGVTLPFAWFADPEIFRLEQERIFAHTWQYGGVADWVAEPGQYFTCHAGLVPIVVVRDREGSVNGFVNICRHRATEVAQGRGRRETLQCPYHAWTYDLDGSLRAAPRSERESAFDRSCLGLRRVAVDTWGPFVFVNRDHDAPPLAEFLGGLPGIIEGAGIDFSRLNFRERSDWEMQANWKAVVENYLECYHCPVAHKAFSALVDVDPDAYRLEAANGLLSQYGERRHRADDRGDASCQFHLVWPALKVIAYPGAANLSLGPVWPEGVEHSAGFLDYFFGRGVPEQVQRELLEFDDQVGLEDRELVESVQRGLRSGLIERGRLLLDSEALIGAFQERVRAALASSL